MPVDTYVGGAEHAVGHLIYSRFFTKVLKDNGYLPARRSLGKGGDFDEPFLKLINQGIILGEDGQKMSKSLGNVINPDEVVEEYGADSFRMYEMFMGPLEDMKPWGTDGIKGMRRFLDKNWIYFVSYFCCGNCSGCLSVVKYLCSKRKFRMPRGSWYLCFRI